MGMPVAAVASPEFSGTAARVTKRCPNCQAEKPLQAFGLRRRSPTGRKSWCKACESLSQQRRYQHRVVASACVRCGRDAAAGRVLCGPCLAKDARSREARKAEGACRCGAAIRGGLSRCADCLARERGRYLVNDTGLEARDYLHLMEIQQGACAICRQRCGTGRRLAVDHDHRTGRVRGLLCFRCNTSLARCEEYARAFAEYLARPGFPITPPLGSAATP